MRAHRPLRHVSDEEPGLRRLRTGTGFRYIDGSGAPVTDDGTLERIKGLVIPPAWDDVWIAPDSRAHIQATGYDSEGRKQYLYHPEWSKAQESTKYDRLVSFGRALPALRGALQADLARPRLPWEKVVAAVVRVMEQSFTRIGSEAYARDGASYGLSTLKEEHLESASGRKVRLRFPGKGGKELEVDVDDARVAAVIRDCGELPGERLFEYCDEDGEVRIVGSADVNMYLKEAMGDGFSSKVFRTWAATTLMVHRLHEAGEQDDAQREAVIREAVKEVADRLENTVAVCKKSYIHPAVPASYLDGSFEGRIEGDDEARPGLWPEEVLTLRLLASFEDP